MSDFGNSFYFFAPSKFRQSPGFSAELRREIFTLRVSSCSHNPYCAHITRTQHLRANIPMKVDGPRGYVFPVSRARGTGYVSMLT